MRRELVTDALWKRVEPLLPRKRRKSRRGRPRCDDRAALRGILFVLKTGIAWEDLPAEVFAVSGITCWRRLDAWTRAHVFERLHEKRNRPIAGVLRRGVRVRSWAHATTWT
ncbi:transposase [Aggregicoccus sp. 17bor-14]|nr:transposase [Simulacricoccus sp. 17bor-14]MRI92118.1 transposase [Aggregicoccus sp. 17bor-14]